MNVELAKINDEEIAQSISRKTQVDNTVKLITSIFKRNWPIVVLFTALGAVPAVLLRTQPPYVGKFEILLEPANSDQSLSDATTILGERSTGESIDYPTQLAILKSPVMLSSIAERLVSEFPGSSKDVLLQNLRIGLSVERIQTGVSRFDKTKIISVAYSSRNRREVLKVLEVTAEKFLEYSLAERQNAIRAGVSFIDNQIPDIQRKISELQTLQQNIQKQHQLIDPEQKGQELFLRNNQLKAQIEEVDSTIKEYTRILNNLSTQVGLTVDQVLLLTQLRKDSNFQSDLQSLRDLETQLKEIDNTINIQSARFSQDSPMLATLEQRRDYIAGLVDEQKEAMLGKYNIGVGNNSNILSTQDPNSDSLMSQMLNTQSQIEVLESRYQSLLATQQQVEAELSQITEVIKNYTELQRQLILTTNTLNQLTLEKEKLNVAGAQQERPWELISPPTIISHALDGSTRQSGISSKQLLGGILAGFLLGMVVAFILERMKNTYNKEADLSWKFNLPILGKITLPPVNTELETEGIKTETKEIDNNLINSPQSLQGAKSLYEEIYFKCKDQKIKSLLICAVEPGDGQAFVSSTLAKVVADAGQKVLLVDTNFAQPAVHKYFSLANEKGLQELLSYSLNPDSVIQQVESSPNLSVLTTGGTGESVNVSLASNQVKSLMELLELKYDLVIYNAPLFLDSSDVSFLASNTQSILMVVRLKNTSQSLVKQAFDKIDSFNLPILGFVVTSL